LSSPTWLGLARCLASRAGSLDVAVCLACQVEFGLSCDNESLRNEYGIKRRETCLADTTAQRARPQRRRARRQGSRQYPSRKRIRLVRLLREFRCMLYGSFSLGGAPVSDYPEITARLSEALSTAEKCSTAETVENYSLLEEQLNELAS